MTESAGDFRKKRSVTCTIVRLVSAQFLRRYLAFGNFNQAPINSNLQPTTRQHAATTPSIVLPVARNTMIPILSRWVSLQNPRCSPTNPPNFLMICLNRKLESLTSRGVKLYAHVSLIFHLHAHTYCHCQTLKMEADGNLNLSSQTSKVRCSLSLHFLDTAFEN